MTDNPTTNTTAADGTTYDRAHDWHALNAMLNLYDDQGRIQFDKDRQAEREYIEKHVRPNTISFESTHDRLDYLIANGYYDKPVFDRYDDDFLDDFYNDVNDCGFEFDTFLGAFKFYQSFSFQADDGIRIADLWLECRRVMLRSV